ncbi:MAG: hypothetical protein IJ002_07390 [Clostridia bacterium]|nr:hypothetical protein [Clostridia bacterium]
MKLKDFFKILGLALFLGALVLFLLAQNPKVDEAEILFPVAFGTVLAFSGACLITGELLKKIEDLEKRAFWLEEEVRKLKEKTNTDKE